ncbi:UNVERIFIED_CONTAM: hypothetical protein RMT77_018995 [Armadillidium vulgare]
MFKINHFILVVSIIIIAGVAGNLVGRCPHCNETIPCPFAPERCGYYYDKATSMWTSNCTSKDQICCHTKCFENVPICTVPLYFGGRKFQHLSDAKVKEGILCLLSDSRTA